jgi:Type I phosphodiesterase / nucleotide pyrophosphatase
MNERARLWAGDLARFRERPLGRFVRPQYDGRSLANLSASLYRAAGGAEPEGRAPALARPLADDLDPTRGARAEGPIVFLLVDGLGWNAFQRALEANERAPGSSTSWAPSAWGEYARPITSVFPSTTTAALTTLSTGCAPATHGIVGHRQYFPRWGLVADILRMAPSTTGGSDTLIGSAWDRSLMSPAPTLFERGLRATAISRDQFEGRGFTRMLYAGAEYRPYATASELAVVLADTVNRPDPPAAIFAYWDELDTSHHLQGPEQSIYDLELERLQHLLSAFARRVDPARRRTTQLWMTGDHGQVPVTPEANVALDLQPAILADLERPLAGDRRAAFLEVRSGRAAHVRDELLPRLPKGSEFLSMQIARDEGLFGPAPHLDELELRTGTHLVLPAAPGGITYHSPGTPPPRRTLRGAHGGLEEDELWVPLIAGSLQDLVG